MNNGKVSEGKGDVVNNGKVSEGKGIVMSNGNTSKGKGDVVKPQESTSGKSYFQKPWFPDKGERIVLDSEENPIHSEKKRVGIDELLNNGIINIDKPAGPTSHQVVSWVRDMLNLKKTGHAGTLDPNVSGVLPVALENATRLLKALLLGGKEYVGLMEFDRKVKKKEILQTFSEFTGKIYQIPPKQAAVKRRLRVREIFSLELMESDGKSTLFRTNTESGTYIRTLCTDIGHRHGVKGWMSDLRRTRSGQFTEENSVTLQELKDSFVFYRENGEEKNLREIIQPVEKMVNHLPEVIVRFGAVDAVCHGAPLAVPGILEFDSGFKPGDLLAMKTSTNLLIAIGKAVTGGNELSEKKSGIGVKPVRVVMETGTYPRMWKQRM